MPKRSFFEVSFVNEHGVHVVTKHTHTYREAYDHALSVTFPGEVRLREVTEHTLARFVVHRIGRNGVQRFYCDAHTLEEALRIVRRDVATDVVRHDVLDRVKQTHTVIKR